MSKMKIKGAAKKRFKITGSGKILRRKSAGSHLLEKKSKSRKRTYAKELDIAPGDKKNVKKILGI
ncbi:MAG: 50S ribosomal protein L35 [Candidatus Aenigmarchaeota archaeon]|nr:50S ribosomal protein L35 [Candidatus Aenigmarchaeota archaeon]